ncbi:hypothetical protein [Geodermatophilus sabuli]|uniref:Uncharacterized protein n=1 Tax=Geodermatophilus sabuli TaxID=1564158 RepID=A0A285E8B8_9ACTN|nr:hypothetical protein [Geodermatophilus sabuli]MBB3081870.1 hypothetical protein [Geodermatophilus sabuli]SNX95257.1 hypothetical protein SAMN06893097_1011065 [Geodermatophilus sabuli]
MDLRVVVFNRIVQDAVLRRLLVNHADRVESGRDPQTGASGCAFLVLRWLRSDEPSASAGCEVLVARAHVPGQQPDPGGRLDHLLLRLEVALCAEVGDDALAIRGLGSSPHAVRGPSDTLARSATFVVVPAPSRLDGERELALVPWPGRAGADAGGLAVPSGAVSSLN